MTDQQAASLARALAQHALESQNNVPGADSRLEAVLDRLGLKDTDITILVREVEEPPAPHTN